MELRMTGHTRGAHECLVYLALTYQALGRAEEAKGVASILNEYHRHSGNTALTAEGQALQLHLNVANGALTADSALPESLTTATAILFGWKLIPAVTQVHILLTAAAPEGLDEARRLLDELIASAEQLHKPARRVEFLALKARVLEQQGARAAAVATLQTAVTVAAPRGLIRSLVDAGPALAPVVQTLLQRTPSPYLQRVLSALQPPVPAAPTPAPVQAPVKAAIRLTRREREVLALLVAYKTDREIAEQLVVSPLTVRTHIEHIGEKFGVSGRRSIIAYAVQNAQGL
jgi:LuxR family maltose regulon positive regulatory protein